MRDQREMRVEGQRKRPKVYLDGNSDTYSSAQLPELAQWIAVCYFLLKKYNSSMEMS